MRLCECILSRSAYGDRHRANAASVGQVRSIALAVAAALVVGVVLHPVACVVVGSLGVALLDDPFRVQDLGLECRGILMLLVCLVFIFPPPPPERCNDHPRQDQHSRRHDDRKLLLPQLLWETLAIEPQAFVAIEVVLVVEAINLLAPRPRLEAHAHVVLVVPGLAVTNLVAMDHHLAFLDDVTFWPPSCWRVRALDSVNATHQGVHVVHRAEP
mmetsp:Transcript_112954/g.364870  ORF Transcript_112954/g.364870 Transcript_112954/m.364870 type:complete len:214 (-) Transcript_112954:667-1308(-)